ncbi:MAG TPA: hypothetical protein PK307_04930 [Spirochaetota bacterium]|nr:hypothetical protein [Spirochaetota bacterium]HOD16045.1 hypothetical protein [Spirochaetota bacterium]HPG50124.1 hypothetical protein [Spirochaetota bacterium]HPN10928.1 hypothetical protein [Spirochaetota bacterium]HQL81521.1 hypothetical protein [Spirochaetota bacterium]
MSMIELSPDAPLNMDAAPLRDYLASGWLTHDGMWFYNAFLEGGIELANHLNLAAIRSMAPMEARRTRKILGAGDGPVRSFDEAAAILSGALRMVLPRSIIARFKVTVPAEGVFRWEWKKGECFAYKGICQLGCIDRYRCGVIFRIGCWLDAMDIQHRIEPMPDACMMHEKGLCRGDIIMEFHNAKG